MKARALRPGPALLGPAHALPTLEPALTLGPAPTLQPRPLAVRGETTRRPSVFPPPPRELW